jgi:glycine/D-amino acid oxidase-like deaminating enzyme
MLSFWEQDAAPLHDALIVGGGIVGLFTAIQIKRRKPQWRVAVLERGLLPSGASTRNAGFACFGSLTEILSDIDRMGRDAALALVEKRFRGLHKLRETLGDAAIGYEHHGGYELLMDAQMEALQGLPSLNVWLRPIFKTDVFQVMKDRNGQSAAAALGFNVKQVRAIVRNPFEGQLHSGKLMAALEMRARESGVEIRNGAEVMDFDENDALAALWVRQPGSKERIPFRASQVVFCANGFTNRLLPGLGIVPARGQILVTEPVPDLRWKGCFHMDEGFVCFRDLSTPEGTRVLLGGARNLAFEAEATDEMAITQTIQERLEQLLRNTILPGKAPRIARRWAGIMGFGPEKKPMVKRLGPRTVLAFGCNGMGVALGSLIADEAAGLTLD